MTLNERHDIEHGLVFAPGDLVSLVSPLLRAAPERHGQLGSAIGHRFLGRFLVSVFCDRAPARIAQSKSSKQGPSPKAGGGCAANRKIHRCDPSADTSQWCKLPTSRPFRRDVPRSRSLQRAAQVPSAVANAFQKQDSLGAMRTQLQRPLFGGVLALEGDMPWCSAVVDSCV